jgi:hypothetical protein
MSAMPLSRGPGSRGHKDPRSVILGSVKRKSSPECDHSGAERPGSGGRSRWACHSWLLIPLLGLIGVAVAVFGHPVQAVAAAIIVSVLGALAQGQSVIRSTASVAQALVQSLKGAGAQDQNGSPRLYGESRVSPSGRRHLP